jgi:hypothetical protein
LWHQRIAYSVSLLYTICLVLEVQFQPATYSVTEGDQVNLTVLLNFDAIVDVMVDISSSNGLATGERYEHDYCCMCLTCNCSFISWF